MTDGRGGRRTALAALLLVPSGAAALAHEAVWARLWTPWAGAGVVTSAAVVAGALLGLAAGAALGGRVTARSRRPGMLFVAAEAVGALLALAVPTVAALLRAADETGSFSPGGPARLAVVTAACLVPCLPLGASLPALVRTVAVDPGTAGGRLRWLYAANTLGAVAGVLLATGWGFERLGLVGTVRAAAAAQALAAAGGLLLAGPAPRPRADGEGDRAAFGVPRALQVAAFLSGAAGLAVQVAWVRRLTPALGTTSYAFGTVLAAYLLAVALGAALLGPRGARAAGVRPVVILALAALPAALLAPALAPAARWAGEALAAALREGEATAGRLLAIRAAAAAALLVPATVLGAAALPWLVQAGDPSPEASGRTSGRLLAVNTLGSAIAAVGTGLFAIPALGTGGTLHLAGVLYLLAAAAAARGRVRGGLAVAALAAVGLVAAGAALATHRGAPGAHDPAARDAVGATFDPGFTDPAAAPATFFAEGRVSTVVVRDRDGRPELWVDGKVVASASPTDRLHLALLGHLPMLAHRDPRRVAVVALGTGITATACAAHAPDVLDVFELEGEVAPASAAFASVGGGLPPTARLHVVDGRYGLLRSRDRYDVITTDPVHPAAAGSAELYTVEHYRLVASRLADDGVACQWLPLYELSTDDVRMVLRTFASVFRTAVFVAGPDLVILGRRGPWALDADAIEARITGPVAGSLRPFGLASPGRLLGLLLADPERTEFLAGEGLWNTDDRPVLEFASARSQYTGSSTENLAWLGFAPSAPATLLAREPRDAAAFAAGVERSRRVRRAMARWMEGGAASLSRALGAFADLAEEDPSDTLSATMRDEVRGLLARDAATRGEAEEAAALAREVLASPAAQDRQRLEAAEVLRDVGRADEARAAATDLLPRLPRSERARRLAGAAR